MFQPGGIQPADHAAIVRHRDDAGLLGDDDGDCVADLGDAERGPMAQPHLPVGDGAPGGERHHAGGGGEAVALQDDGPVVQRRIRVKRLQEQLSADGRVESDARVGVILQPHLPLDDDEAAMAALGEALGGGGDGVNHRLHVRGPRGKAEGGPRTPQPLQRAPDFRGEDDRDGDEQGRQGVAQQPRKGAQAEHGREQGDGQEEEHDATQQHHGLRPAHQPEQAVNHQRHEQDVNDTDRVEAGEEEEKFAEEFSHGNLSGGEASRRGGVGHRLPINRPRCRGRREVR